VIRRIVDGGGTIVAGTDSPIHPYGFALLTELEDYVKVGGLTPLQALQSATVNAARALGAEDDLGAVAPGMLADLVILDGNPLEDIENLRGVRAVMVNGNLHRIDELLASPAQTIQTKEGGR
jgi:imidazolonepropionase-like amidohydrolase